MSRTSGPKISLLRAKRIVVEYHQSGKSIAEFARERGIQPQTLRWYMKRIENNAAVKKSKSTKKHPAIKSSKSPNLASGDKSPEIPFVSVNVEDSHFSKSPKGPESTAPSSPLRLEFPTIGCHLNIEPGFDPENLKLVIEILSSGECSCSN